MADQKNNSPPSVAVIGSGYWGKNLVRNFHQLGALRLICDKNETVLNSFKEQYPDVETCYALNDALSREDINGLVIATPAEIHFTLAREALLAGKHVFVEKPLVLDEQEGEELIGLSNDENRVLMVGHLLQYHPVFIKLKELALSGELGRINYIYSNRMNLGKIRREKNGGLAEISVCPFCLQPQAKRSSNLHLSRRLMRLHPSTSNLTRLSLRG